MKGFMKRFSRNERGVADKVYKILAFMLLYLLLFSAPFSF